MIKYLVVSESDEVVEAHLVNFPSRIYFIVTDADFGDHYDITLTFHGIVGLETKSFSLPFVKTENGMHFYSCIPQYIESLDGLIQSDCCSDMEQSLVIENGESPTVNSVSAGGTNGTLCWNSTTGVVGFTTYVVSLGDGNYADGGLTITTTAELPDKTFRFTHADTSVCYEGQLTNTGDSQINVFGEVPSGPSDQTPTPTPTPTPTETPVTPIIVCVSGYQAIPEVNGIYTNQDDPDNWTNGTYYIRHWAAAGLWMLFSTPSGLSGDVTHSHAKPAILGPAAATWNELSIYEDECPTPTPTPTPTNNVEETLSDYIYDSMEATSIIGGDDGSSSVGWNDRSLTTIQGVAGVDGLSINNNIVTLTESGRYYIKARTGAWKSDYMKTRISFLSGDYLNVNFVGPKRWASDQVDTAIVSESVTIVDITQTTTFKIQTHVTTAQASYGLTSGGESTLFVQKLADDTPSGGGGGGLTNWTETNGHIIPNSNADFDLGNAEYKVRHLFLSDNSIWIGDSIKQEGGKKKKRKADKLPKWFANSLPGTTAQDAIQWYNAEYDPDITTLDEMPLSALVEFARVKTGDDSITASDLYPAEKNANGSTDDNYDPTDYEYIVDAEDTSYVNDLFSNLPENVAGKYIKVNNSNDGWEFVDPPAGSFLSASTNESAITDDLTENNMGITLPENIVVNWGGGDKLLPLISVDTNNIWYGASVGDTKILKSFKNSKTDNDYGESDNWGPVGPSEISDWDKSASLKDYVDAIKTRS